MAIAALQTILDRIDSWPEERQERAAQVLLLFEENDAAHDLEVSDDDLAEIDRRLADKDAQSISLEEFRLEIDRMLTRRS